ncbi:MAG: hypothetical protein IPO30_13455 [Hyphomonadaceae bacterium]|nr:hypothetical protein [Hyphomonadaceae bacterium]MBP9233849.1 hypothetical protein [Hyphomonadaceae bacterium]
MANFNATINSQLARNLRPSARWRDVGRITQAETSTAPQRGTDHFLALMQVMRETWRSGSFRAMDAHPPPRLFPVTLLAVIGLAGCGLELAPAPPRPEADLSALAVSFIDNTVPRDPLPLLAPYAGVMVGIIDSAASAISTIARLDRPLTDTEWTGTGLAGVNIISASTLLTLPASGPDDARRLADPRWRDSAEEMQSASVLVLAAVQARDTQRLRLAADLLKNTCQACHRVFKQGSRVDGRDFASRS